jgi:hypothetical protein
VKDKADKKPQFFFNHAGSLMDFWWKTNTLSSKVPSKFRKSGNMHYTLALAVVFVLFPNIIFSPFIYF